MKKIRTSGELAAALGGTAREIAAEHGDEAAQTVTYALFLRRVEPEARVGDLIERFPEAAAVSRVESILDATDLGTAFTAYASEGKDPAVYFFEEFVRACDPANSRRRGVHYSPPAVVSYMVRGVESILAARFGVGIDGATVLDPCCGIGTFLRHIEESGKQPPAIASPLLCGMELMPVASELAGRLLRGSEVVRADALSQPGIGGWELGVGDAGVSGFPLRSNPEAGVPGSPLRSDPETPAPGPLVVVGNPPYSGHSANAGKIGGLMADYRAGLDERNPKWLQDDYVKFIRIAQHWVDLAGGGIVAFITNHSFIFNPTFRAMRESLMGSFDELYFLDLHGNAKLVERTADGEPDENVFPIQMGVAISFMVKTASSGVILNPSAWLRAGSVKNLGRRGEILRAAQDDAADAGEGSGCRVFHAEIRGTREQKLRALSEMDFETTPWTELKPVKPFVLFTRQDGDVPAEYARFPSLVDMFRETSVGFVTSRDQFAVAFTREELLERIADLRDDRIPPDEIRARYPVGDLDIESARRTLQADPDWREKAVEALYRPFDRRWAYLSRAVMERPRLPFMECLLGENVALAVGRAGHATGSREWDVVFCTDCPTDLNLFRRGGAMLFPRWVYRDGLRLSNVRLDSDEEDRLFWYVYAILHSGEYRARYRELLMVDFPRVPVSQDAETFEALATLGEELMRTHLGFGIGNLELGNAGEAGRVESALRIGGYDLPRKYVQDRRRRALTQAERDQIEGIRQAVARTVEIRAAIDDLAQLEQL